MFQAAVFYSSTGYTFTVFLHTWNSFCYFNIRVQIYKGACSLKVQNYFHSVCSYCYRMLCFGALGSAGQRNNVEIHCLEQSYKNVGRWLGVRYCFCSFLCTQDGELPHWPVRFTWVSFLTGYINPVLSPSVGAVRLSESRDLPTYPDHLALKEKWPRV